MTSSEANGDFAQSDPEETARPMSVVVDSPVGSAEQQIQMTSGERHASEQLRAVAEAIKNCPPLDMPANPYANEGFADIYGPPQSVVWNIEPDQSIRSRYLGSIELSEPSYFKVPPDDSYCNKPRIKKDECRRMWVVGMKAYLRQSSHPLRFLYEFDLGADGLAFRRAFKKTSQTDDEKWQEGDMNSDGCAFRAMKSVLSQSDTEAHVADAPASQEGQSSEIPKSLWDAAQNGAADAQYTIGTMYAEGRSVPQDYVEAYFWLDLAATGNSDLTIREIRTKARDSAASHLPSELLLHTQDRARKWFAEHQGR